MKNLLVTICLSSTLISFSQDPFHRTDGFSTLWANPATYGLKYKFEANVVGQKFNWGSGIENNALMMNAGYRIEPKKLEKLSFGVGYSHAFRQLSSTHTNMFSLPLNAQYSFDDWRISAGVAPGLHYRNGYSWWPVTKVEETKFMLSAGFAVSTDFLTFSAGINHITSERFTSDLVYTEPTSIALMSSGVIPIKEWSLVPVVTYHYQGGFQYLSMLLYVQTPNEYFSLGGGYEFGSAYVLAARAKYKGFALGYAFHQSISTLTNSISPSHELRLSYLLDNRKEDNTVGCNCF